MPTGTHSYAVMGATGHIGKVVTERLLKRGTEVRVIGRSTERLKGLAVHGAVPHVAAFDDADALCDAFCGAEAVFVMIPSDYTTGEFLAYQDRVGVGGHRGKTDIADFAEEFATAFRALTRK